MIFQQINNGATRQVYLIKEESCVAIKKTSKQKMDLLQLLVIGISMFIASFNVNAQEGSATDGIDKFYTLTIENDDVRYEYSSTDLLSRKDIETISIRDVSAYPRVDMTFTAIKFATFLQELKFKLDSTIEFIAMDGFTAPLEPSLLLNTSIDKSIAYLAIEDPDNKWPAHRSGEGTAGPFYLLWTNPELSDIGREEWPYKFNLVVIKGPFEKLYPDLIPRKSNHNYQVLNAGFEIYVKNCIACHKLDQVGPGAMGPDLNYPMSPLDYFKDGILRKFIRNPQSIRENPKTTMGGFSRELISDEEMDRLLAYLDYMTYRNIK